jgi:hypothetical protein
LSKLREELESTREGKEKELEELKKTVDAREAELERIKGDLENGAGEAKEKVSLPLSLLRRSFDG